MLACLNNSYFSFMAWSFWILSARTRFGWTYLRMKLIYSMHIKATSTIVSLLASNTCILSKQFIKVLGIPRKFNCKNHAFYPGHYRSTSFALVWNACKPWDSWNKESWDSELRFGEKSPMQRTQRKEQGLENWFFRKAFFILDLINWI